VPEGVARSRRPSRITVLAGTNGAGKSTVAGEALIQAGMEFFDPDKAARQLAAVNPTLSQDELNSAAWNEGKRLLEWAIDHRIEYAFETTLGGTTIPSLLQQAAAKGIEVLIWYAGLSSIELHIARVKARVAQGGHDIPEEKIRQRYAQSVLNLIRLMPSLTELLVYDNSQEADPRTGATPTPLLVLHLKRGNILRMCDPAATPAWAKPILVTALKIAAK
jgi:predicted ABC-type ATPase